MSIEELVAQEIRTVADEQGKTLAPLEANADLLDLGLDSLCFAILVSRLEDRTGVDPFAAAGAEFPRTLGDLVALYQTAHV